MIAIRLREFGSADWTEVLLEGELEEFAASALAACLADNASLHVQQRIGAGDWESL